MSAYYNENDPKAAAWLRELIEGGHIAPGEVDERSIEDIRPGELVGYTQCHFFAGIGGWSYALRLAGWPDDKPVWTGSCPCQPFSAAGKGTGFADERHLWPAWHWLIRHCRPERVFGEQVASAMQWIDLVQGDLEAEGYAVGYSVLGAHSVGAPHIRQRLYWMADRARVGWREERPNAGGVAAGDRAQRRPAGLEPSSGFSIPADAGSERGRGGEARGEHAGHAWQPSETLPGRDGKYRHIEPGTFPLAHGVSGRVGLLRGYGNAIVPQVAAAFIQATELV